MEGKYTTPMCRYFRLGKCTRGDGCPFSHDLAHPDSFICPYFLEGFCKYGSRCQYDHKQPEIAAQSKWKTAKQERSTSEASTLSADTAPWRPSNASHRQKDELLSSCASPWRPSTNAAPFTVSKSRSGQPQCSSTAPAQDDKRPVCIYYQTGACSFGEKCRFKHAAPKEPSAIAEAVATAEHATRTLVNLRNLETLPTSKQKPHVLASLNWSQACSKPASDAVQVAPLKHTSAWGNSLIVDRNPNGFPQTLPEASSAAPNGWKVLDSNVDELDPWERSQNPQSIPLRPPREDLDSTARKLAPEDAGVAEEESMDPSELLCAAYTTNGFCENIQECPCLHGDECPCCGYYCLHPTDADLREQHQTACFAMYEEMQRLEEMQKMECSICLEPVLLKEDPSARCFGLLDCEHCFCLPCIRSWRGNTFADIDSATRACPECRKKSHFVTPSQIWPATEDEKNIIVEDYKMQLQEKHCKHFDHGRGTCPFGTSCFYRHEFLDGSLEDRTKLPDVRFVTNSDGEFTHVRDNTLASAFNTARNSRLLSSRR